MKLIVGLGNPDEAYAATRHNVGFRVIDLLAEELKLRLNHMMGVATWGEGSIDDIPIALAKPLVFMNDSGLAISALLSELRLTPSDLIVVHDDLDLSLGQIRIRASGTSGGHRGLQSVIDTLGTIEFARVRVGIGRPRGRQDPAVFVLRPFTKDELEEIEFAVVRAADAVVAIVTDGFDRAMNLYNRFAEDGPLDD